MYHCSNNFKVVDKHHEEKVVMEVVKSVHGSLWGCSFQKVIPLNKEENWYTTIGFPENSL